MWRLSKRFEVNCLILAFLSLQINCFPSLEKTKDTKNEEQSSSKHEDEGLDEAILEELRQKIDSLSKHQAKKEDHHRKLSEQLDNCSENSEVQDLMKSFEVKQGNDKTKRTTCKTDKPDDVFQDVFKTINQRSNPTGNNKLENATEMRNFLSGARLWPNGRVPYVIDEDFSESENLAIENALQEMRTKTCIDFTPKTDELLEDLGFGSYIKFIRNTRGCWSYVGRVFNKEQGIGLQSPGCVTHKIVIHEIMHALGMDHEHSRSDRDDYVDMHWENIIDGTNNLNMKKYKTYDQNPFDGASVLQYSLKAFSKNGKATMSLTDSELSFLAGSAEKLDFYDAKDINDRYQCADHCINKPECENGGYVGPDCKCMCPSGLLGTTCTDLETDDGCGGFLDVSEESKTIESPNYPENYPKDKQCLWLIKTNVGNHVKIFIKDLAISYNSVKYNCYHWLQIRYNLIAQEGPRICGEDLKDEYYTTRDGNPNMMYLLFDSRSSQDKETSKGFSIQASSVKPCESSPCLNSGTCINGDHTYHCSCTPEWKGYTCSVPVDPCHFSPCQHGSTCQSSETTFSCLCTAEWKGEFCDKKVRPCDSSPCQNGGVCANADNEFTCKCPSEWEGPTCNTKVRPCDSSPCQNGGVCANADNELFTCTCPTEWKGTTCNTKVPPCDLSPCENGGVCANTDDGFTCTCPTKWAGKTCNTKVPPCDLSPCENGGVCANTEDDFTCTCPTEWKGKTCNIKVPPCDLSPCENEGVCANAGDDFTCTCLKGWEGKTCNTKVPPCDLLPCENGGVCANTEDDFTCTCLKGWEGKTCNTKVPPCDLLPCENGGVCANTEDDFTCTCPTEWKGKTCNIKVPPCDLSPCENEGVCANTEDDFTCACTTEWEGKTCNTKAVNRRCTFENGDDCFLVQSENDFFNWNMGKKGKPESKNPGKNAAAKGDYYGLARGRNRRRNKSAIICSKETFPGGEYCLQYFYNMRGTGIGSLNVSFTDSSGNHPVLLKTGTPSQRNTWLFSVHDIITTSEMQVCFNATIGNKTYSGVALDEVSLTSGTCGCSSDPCLNGGACVPEQDGYMCECPTGFLGLACEITDRCDFEVEVENCFLMEPTTGDYTGWNQFSEDTDIEQYMPRPYSGMRYLFIATDSSYTIQNARLETPIVKFRPGAYCLRFWYYQSVDSPLSYISVTADENEVMFSGGLSVQNWELRSVAVTLRENSRIAVSANLHGVGLIAIDDVSLALGDCERQD